MPVREEGARKQKIRASIPIYSETISRRCPESKARAPCSPAFASSGFERTLKIHGSSAVLVQISLDELAALAKRNFGATTLAGAMDSRLAKSALRFAQTCLRTGLTGRIFPAWIPQPFAFSSAFAIKYIMTDEDERELETELARLQQEHRDLDAAIDALHQSPAPDLLRLQRLKKRKLQLRDRIAFIEDQITPDIIA
jgi:hypothetical protein